MKPSPAALRIAEQVLGVPPKDIGSRHPSQIADYRAGLNRIAAIIDKEIAPLYVIGRGLLEATQHLNAEGLHKDKFDIMRNTITNFTPETP